MIKGILYFILCSTLFLSCHKNAPENPPTCNFVGYFYYNGAQFPIGEGLSNNYLWVAFDTTYSVDDIRKFISSVSDFDQRYKYTLYNSKAAALKFNKPKTCEEITGIIANLEKNAIVTYAHYTMKSYDCQSAIMIPMGNLCVYSYNNFFNVKVIDVNDLTSLHKMMAETNTELVEQNQFMPDWFTLKATKKSKGDGLHMANYFYESKLFVHAEPNYGRIPVE
ncbi:MAG: hypothetical protein HYU70_05210 [Bacteroidetes bacterium]|nr:hypothetical protein [Bacteroidota bacterium]